MSAVLTRTTIYEDMMVPLGRSWILGDQIERLIENVTTTADLPPSIFQSGCNVVMQFCVSGQLLVNIITLPAKLAADEVMNYVKEQHEKRTLC